MKKEEQDDPIVTIGQHTNDVKGKDTRQGVKPRNVNENINKAPVTSRGRAKGRNTKGKAVGKRKSRTGDDSDDDKNWTPGVAESAQEEHDAQIARAVASGHEFDDVIVWGPWTLGIAAPPPPRHLLKVLNLEMMTSTSLTLCFTLLIGTESSSTRLTK